MVNKDKISITLIEACLPNYRVGLAGLNTIPSLLY